MSKPLDIETKLKYSKGGFNTVERDNVHKQIIQSDRENRYEFLLNVKDKYGKKQGDPDYDPTTLHIPSSTLTRMTPFEKQYWKIKMNNYDVLIFFAKGKFYELYETDADVGNKELGLKVTYRVNMRMAGVPLPQFSKYAGILLERGYKIGCVNEMETGDQMKKREKTIINGKREPNIVDRQLVRIFTISTATDPELLRDSSDSYCLALTHTGLDVAICYGDVTVGRFFVGYIEDTEMRNNLHTLLHRVHPKEIILAKNCNDEIKKICNNLGFAEVTFINTPENGTDVVNELFKERGRVPKVIEEFSSNESIMNSLCMLHHYLESLKISSKTLIDGTFGKYSTTSSDTLIVDAQSIVNLALFTRSGKEKEGTLLHFIDNCLTPFGKRMLREHFLLKPLTDIQSIIKRQDLVEFWIENNVLLDDVKTFLKPLPDLERFLCQCKSSTISESNFIKMIKGFETCQKLINELKTVSPNAPEILQTIVDNTKELGFPSLEEFIEKMEGIYDFEAAERNGVINFQGGYNDSNDAVLVKREEIKKEFKTELDAIKKTFGSTSLSYISLNGEDHVIDVPTKVYDSYMKKNKKLPVGFTEVNTIKAGVRVLSSKVSSLQSEFDLLEQQINDSHKLLFTQLMNEVANTNILVRAIQNIGYLDCFISLAIASSNMDESCMPSFVQDGVLYTRQKAPQQSSIKGPYFNASTLKHPYLSVSTTAMPSDVGLGNDAPQTILLTGPNMGGKSTLLRTVCLAVIMAQMGMRCTATEMTLSIIDRIFTRIGASDDILHGKSTFMVELDETAQMLHSATENSLVILDELGRGTSTHDGLAIAHAVVKYVVGKVKPLMICSTHYHQLCDEFGERDDVKLSHMGCHVQDGKIVFLYTLLDGSCPKSYGMKVAEMAGLPQGIVRRAEAIAVWFEMYSLWKTNSTVRKFTDVVFRGKRTFE